MNALEEPPQILGINTRRDSVPQVRNPPPLALSEACTHALYSTLDRGSPSIQHIGIKVALKRDLVTDDATRLDGIDTPVEPEDVISCVLCQKAKCVVGTFSEERHGCRWEVLLREATANIGGDVFQGREREQGKVVRGQFTGPRIEYLKQL